jgi:hypothetical protein
MSVSGDEMDSLRVHGRSASSVFPVDGGVFMWVKASRQAGFHL